jgi:hypothetical membrane protein
MLYAHSLNLQLMDYDDKKVAGSLLFVGVVQYVLAVVICEAIYSGYSVRQQLVSELGDWSLAGNNAAVYDVSVIFWGISLIMGAYYIQRALKDRLFTSLLVISGVCAVFAGIVALNISYILHGIFGLVVFVFGAASAIWSYKFVKAPLSCAPVVLGVVSLLATALLILGQRSSDFYLGLGAGGMERFIIYPLILWLLGFGAYLIGDSSDKK